jgi:hypothetical protein
MITEGNNRETAFSAMAPDVISRPGAVLVAR